MASDLFNQNTGSPQAIATYGPWVVLEGGANIPTGNLGQYRTTVGGGYNTARNTTDTPSAEQDATVVITSAQITAGQYCGPAVRCQSGANSSYHVDCNGPSYYRSKCLAGTQSTLDGPITISMAAGEKIKLRVNTVGGNAVLKVYKNTLAAPTVYTQVGSDYTDSSSPILTAGQYGVFGYGDGDTGGFGAGAFEGVDLAATTTPSRRKKQVIHPGNHPGRFGMRIRTRRHDTPALATITGTLATTNANDTLAASGTTTVTGTLATTNANDTLAASGTTTVTGTLAKTNANDTSAASGTTTVTGTSAVTNANDTADAAGTVATPQGSRRSKIPVHPGAGPYNFLRFKRSTRNTAIIAESVSGTLATTNANDTLSAAGTTTVTGALATTNAADTLSASGTTTVTGTLAKTNANDTVSADGTTTITGTLAKTNANDTLSAAGTTTVTGTAATTNANDTLAASGFLPSTGTVNVTNANDTIAATGTGPAQGGGNGGKKKFKSWDQRERERLEQIAKDKNVSDKFGDLPPALAKVIRDEQPFKRLSPASVKAYANARAQDDEEAMHVIMALI